MLMIDREAVVSGMTHAPLMALNRAKELAYGRNERLPYSRLRRTGVCVLAGVRAAGEGKNNGAPAPGTPGRAVRDRRACRSHRRRRPRSHGSSARTPETRVGTRHAPGVSRAHPWFLRRRVVAVCRSASSEPGKVLLIRYIYTPQ